MAVFSAIATTITRDRGDVSCNLEPARVSRGTAITVIGPVNVALVEQEAVRDELA